MKYGTHPPWNPPKDNLVKIDPSHSILARAQHDMIEGFQRLHHTLIMEATYSSPTLNTIPTLVRHTS